MARKDFGRLPTIKIESKNKDDLSAFAAVWHAKIEAKFGQLRSGDCHIANIIVARAQSTSSSAPLAPNVVLRAYSDMPVWSLAMFIFAELMAKYLEEQPSRYALLEEFKPSKLPAKLDLDGLLVAPAQSCSLTC